MTMPPQIKQAKLETLEAIIKEVEGIEEHNLSLNKQKHFCEIGEHDICWDGNYYTCADCGWEFRTVAGVKRHLLTKLQAQKELLEK